MRIILVVLLGFLVACAERGVDRIHEIPLSTEIETTNGKVIGNARQEGLLEFLGIPYASAPVGELRWQPPQPIEDWKGKLDATKSGLPCVQPATLSDAMLGSTSRWWQVMLRATVTWL